MTRDELQQELHTSLIVWFDAPDPKLKKMADFLAMRLHSKMPAPCNHVSSDYSFDQEYGVK